MTIETFGQSSEPKFSEINKVIKILLSTEKREKYESTQYFELHYKGDNDLYKSKDTIRLYTKRDSALENGSVGTFTLLKNGTLGICYHQGSVGKTTAFTTYVGKNIFVKTTTFPRYKILEYEKRAFLEIDTDKNETYRFAIIELTHNGDNYTFVIKRLQ